MELEVSFGVAFRFVFGWLVEGGGRGGNLDGVARED